MGWEETKKARERLGREQGTVVKDWGGKIPIALIYPNSYFIGMSNLGVHAIYSLLNSRSDIVCERVFWEPKDSTKKVVPISLESQRPLPDFAVLAFSVSYELDYFNVAQILKASGIPLYAAARDERHPLVIAGGPCVTTNPMPLSPFFDCLCIGEAEALLPTILPVLTEGVKGRRDELLKTMSKVPGVFIPQYFTGTSIPRQWAASLDDFPVVSTIITPDTELGNLYLMEVERGCNWQCAFCLVSNTFRPIRFRSLEKLVAQGKVGLNYRKRLGLLGPAVTAHPQIEELLETLCQLGAKLSVSSLRVKPLPDRVLAALARGGAETITLAPEAGSHRLRQLIRKGISEEDILSAVERASRLGMKQVKLYFMFGLPTETDDDIEDIIKLVINCKSRAPTARITINVAPFVPKAGTPLEREPMTPPDILSTRLSLIKNSLQPRGVKVKTESPAWSEVQAVFSRGDASVAKMLADVDKLSLAEWRRAVKKQQFDVDFYAYKKWSSRQKPPWAIIDLSGGISSPKCEID